MKTEGREAVEKNIKVETMVKPMMIIVDDDPDVATLIRHVSEEVGFQVSTTTSPQVFQKLIKITKPSLIVMDVVMPGMDGHELLDWLIQVKCTSPIILMSGYSGEYLEVASTLGIAKGANIHSTMQKPFSVKELSAELAKVYSERLWDRSCKLEYGVEYL